MNLVEIVLSQLSDPLRIGLLVALLFVAANGKGLSNRWVPLALGLAFVAVLIPTAMASGVDEPVGAEIGIGFVTNALVVGLMLVAEAALNGFRRKN